MVSGWQTMTDINCSTKEQFSPNHSGLQSMLVRAVSDCKSSNHIVISATRPYWWWKSSERKLWCLSLLHVYWLHTAWVLFMTQAVCWVLGMCISHGYWQPPDLQSRTHTRMPFLISQLSKSYWASDWSVYDRSWPLIGWSWTQPGLDPGSGW